MTFGEGRTNALCVEFSEAEISGADLLQRSGFPALTASGSGGAAVCDIGGIGCQDPGDCFCQCHGSGCQYWAYYTLDGGAWKYSAVGASTRTVRNGDVDGWAWGSGGIGSGAKPEARTFDEVCPPPTEDTPAPPATTTPTSPTTQPGATPPFANGTLPPTPTLFVPIGTFPPALADLGKLPTAMERWRQADETPSHESGFPWEIPVFGAGAIVLLGAALMLKRRASGKGG